MNFKKNFPLIGFQDINFGIYFSNFILDASGYWVINRKTFYRLEQELSQIKGKAFCTIFYTQSYSLDCRGKKSKKFNFLCKIDTKIFIAKIAPVS